MKEMMGKSQNAYPQVSGTQAAPRATQRAKITDVDGIQHALQVAALTLLPDEVSGRALINRLMPQLYQLRKKGFSYKALTRVINDAIGDPAAKLQPSTVKTYYNEFLVERLDDCQAQLKETMQLMSQIDKHSAKSSQELLAEGVRVRSMMANSVERSADAATQRILTGQQQKIATQTTAPLASAATPPMAPRAPSAAIDKEHPPARRPEGATAPSAPVLPQEMRGDGLVVPSMVPAEGEAQPPNRAPQAAASASNAVQATKSSDVSPTAAVAPGSGTLVCNVHPEDSMQHASNSELFENNPSEFFSEGSLEHPAIPGLMLTRPQRMYKSRLEYQDSGASQMETGQQMAARFSWRKSKKVAESRTQKSFVAMDSSLFATAGTKA